MSETIKLITISPIQCKQITQRNDCIKQKSKGKGIDPHNAGYHWYSKYINIKATMAI